MPDDKEVEKLGVIDSKAFGASVDKLEVDLAKSRATNAAANSAASALSSTIAGNGLISAVGAQAGTAYQPPVGIEQIKAIQNLPPPPPGTGKLR